MNNLLTIRVVLALLVLEKFLSKKQAETAIVRIENAFLRGVIPPLPLDELVDILSGDS